ncbi:HD domain-containing protein [Falsiruegeria mediterranea]|jgi:5'-deoxynucleotidase YfbR-like HD superfamily hydrolase|uniref:5'-deoxynucleotidase n=1 Tax=Falsiruegeria mediterranea M17 TaxID=1200281 RepID=A0A2R8C998_9RHOB|nr:HD domain-containing protein [Falsiruegeria mediterranea]SPJ28953.1 5'-deoxynucleotidase YfbR [Falsiruegeria mediterranea M17]
MTNARISAQIAFLKEADRLKQVDRSNVLLDLSRPENSAEHSWHLALYALIFAPMAGRDVSLDRVIRMLLLHDLVEIDVGDHPIHEAVDWDDVAKREQLAARRIFGLLPDDQAAEYLALWTEFEADETPDAQFAKMLDRSQPLFQVLYAPAPLPDHLQIVRDNLASGRAAYLQQACPEIYWHAKNLLGKADAAETGLVPQWLTFLAEADQLKSIYRASRLIDDSRFENSAEHSWHIMLYAMVLADQAGQDVQIDRVLRMLLIHDIVEIDAGDAPIHGQVDHAAMAAKEEAAAERLFGLLPQNQYQDLHRLWHEFEGAETPDAQFAKSVDRVQTPIANLENGGGSWVEYNVTLEQIDQRVGVPVKRGAPDLWAWLRPQLLAHFDKLQTA